MIVNFPTVTKGHFGKYLRQLRLQMLSGLKAIQTYTKSRLASALLFSFFINIVLLAVFEAVFRNNASIIHASKEFVIPIDLVVDPAPASKLEAGNVQANENATSAGGAEGAETTSASEISGNDGQSRQSARGTVPAPKIKLPTAETSHSNEEIDVWSGYCETKQTSRLYQHNCTMSLYDFSEGADAKWRDAVKAVKKARDEGIANHSAAELIWPEVAIREKDIRIIKDLTDPRRRGVERMMDPVPALLGRSVIPDPTWTLVDDPYFDLEKLEELEEALGEAEPR